MGLVKSGLHRGPDPSPAPISGGRLLEQLRRRHERRRRLFPRAIAVGLLVGVVASCFRAAIERAEEWRTELVHFLHRSGGAGMALFLLLCAVAAVSAAWLVRRFEPSAAGSGIPQIKAVLHRLRGMSAGRLLGIKFAGGVVAISGGLALGREGPTIQMGGAIGRLIARWFPSSSHERGILIAAGAGAGLAAAFNAPLAGLMFVLEEIQRNFAPGIFSTSFLACVVADAVSRVLFGQSAVLHTAAIAAPPVASVPLFLALGILVGAVAVLFDRGLLAALALADRVPAQRKYLWAASVGALLGLVGWFSPTLIGGGGALVESAISGRGLIAGLLAVLAVRLVLTLGSYSTGAPGGIFAPLLVLGAHAGLAAGLAAATLWPTMAGEPRAWAIAGMAALFAGTVRAPLTGIVLMLEMTETYKLMLPLLAASFAAQWIADRLGEPPIYDSLLERELRRNPAGEVNEGAVLVELDVLPDAPFSDRRVADLGLPPGCLLVTLDRRGRSLVVTGETRLRAGDRLQVLIAPEAGEAVGILREGLGIERRG